MFGRWQFVSIRMGYGGGMATIIPLIASSSPLEFVMDEWRDIMGFLEGFGGSSEGLGVVGRAREEG